MGSQGIARAVAGRAGVLGNLLGIDGSSPMCRTPPGHRGELLLANYPVVPGGRPTLTLRPWQTRVY